MEQNGIKLTSDFPKVKCTGCLARDKTIFPSPDLAEILETKIIFQFRQCQLSNIDYNMIMVKTNMTHIAIKEGNNQFLPSFYFIWLPRCFPALSFLYYLVRKKEDKNH